jgi:KaiC/GvpD/RAD55 family RecA-like ATPase
MPQAKLKVYTRARLRVVACYQGPDEPPLTIENEFEYVNPQTGQIDLLVFRLRPLQGKKQFRQAIPAPGGWVLSCPPKPWPIYNRTRVSAAKTIVVVEGEACVHALTDVLPEDMAATTSPCGAGKANLADWTPLAGKTVYLWPDCDQSGLQHMRDVADILQKLDPPAQVHRLRPDDLGLTDPGDDVVDYLALYGGDTPEARRDAIGRALSTAAAISPAIDLGDRIEDIIAGRYAALGWPFEQLSQQTQALLPGTVTLLCGNPGATKSFFLLQSMLHWHTAGVKVALFELEEDRAFWLMRTLALVSGQGRLTETDWVRDNAANVRALYATHRSVLDRFAPHLTIAPDKQVTHADLVAWVNVQAKAGCRVIGADPITALAPNEKPWDADLRLMMDLKAVARRYGCSLVLVTHPRIGAKGKSPNPLDTLAGGAAFVRFSQTVLTIHPDDHGRRCEYATGFKQKATSAINRTVYIAKARNAGGSGREVAFHFDGGTLKFSERGVILGDVDDAADEVAL